jgi:hypothetical protein
MQTYPCVGVKMDFKETDYGKTVKTSTNAVLRCVIMTRRHALIQLEATTVPAGADFKYTMPQHAWILMNVSKTSAIIQRQTVTIHMEVTYAAAKRGSGNSTTIVAWEKDMVQEQIPEQLLVLSF